MLKVSIMFSFALFNFCYLLVSTKSFASVHGKPVILALFDTGVELKNKYIEPKNIWINPGEVGFDRFGKSLSSNSIDDDQNGYIDDVNGINLYGEAYPPARIYNHGTTLACIMNRMQVDGLPIKIMPVVVFDANLGRYEAKYSFDYAIQQGAKVINMSFGAGVTLSEELASIKNALEAGAQIVASEPNDNVATYFPADYDLKNIIRVARYNSRKSREVQYKPRETKHEIVFVDMDIFFDCSSELSTTGNSMATAIVSMAIAQYLSRHSTFAIDQIVTKKIVHGKPQNVLDFKKVYGNMNSVEIKMINDYGN